MLDRNRLIERTQRTPKTVSESSLSVAGPHQYPDKDHHHDKPDGEAYKAAINRISTATDQRTNASPQNQQDKRRQASDHCDVLENNLQSRISSHICHKRQRLHGEIVQSRSKLNVLVKWPWREMVRSVGIKLFHTLLFLLSYFHYEPEIIAQFVTQ